MGKTIMMYSVINKSEHYIISRIPGPEDVEDYPWIISKNVIKYVKNKNGPHIS